MEKPSISTLLLRPVLAALPAEQHARFFRATDLSLEQVRDPDARVSAAQFCIAWAELTRVAGPHVALAIAEQTEVGAFGLVEYVCRSAPTLGESLAQWVRFLNLLDDAVEVELAIGDDAAVRVVRESEAPTPASHELCFALLVRHARAIAQPSPHIVRVEFAHPMTDETPYASWFGAPVVFNAHTTQLVFDASSMNSLLETSDPNLAALLSRQAESEALQLDKREDLPFTDQVRRRLQIGLKDHLTTIEQMASVLGMTSRTLQRRLHDDGTSFQELRDSVRRELADHYLEGDLSIAEISFLLGFSQPSAFFRAFKRWTGVTPREFRLSRG